VAERTQRYFDTNAAKFDSLYHEGQPMARFINRWLRKAIYERFSITMEKAEPIKGRSFLDVGCGSGRYSVEFAERGGARVVGLDYAEGMLTLARQLAAEKGVADRCTFVAGDFKSIPLDEKFDVSIAIGVFDYQDKPVEFMRRMVERTTGTVIATFPGKSLFRMRLRQFRYWLGDCPVLFYTEAEVRDIAKQAGIKHADIVYMPSSGTGFVLAGKV
jgi:ubiquinone/menaquinone biosynthesis C-methylase UbiE